MVKKDLSAVRKEYGLHELTVETVDADPFAQFARWYEEATNAGIDEPNAMTLATASTDGRPSARIVLLKGLDQNGFVFFTNYLSRKGRELRDNPYGALLFFWKELERQVRIEGEIELLSGKGSDEYFLSRPAESRIAAAASPQSEVIPSREYLTERFDEFRKLSATTDILRPIHWGGYCLVPHELEFWQGRASRLHDRIRYQFRNKAWHVERLAP